MNGGKQTDYPHALDKSSRKSVKPVFNLKAVLRNTAHYMSASYTARILCGLRSMINARCLGPDLYGFWGTLAFLVSFGFHFHGGVQDIMLKQIPAYRSRGREKIARRIAQQAFSFFATMLFMATGIIWIVAFMLPHGTPGFMRFGWWIIGLILPLEILYYFDQNVTRSEERFNTLNRSLLIANAVSLALTCWLVVAYGIWGLFVTAIATPAIGIWYLRRQASYPWRFVWSWRILKRMLAAGWPILAVTIVFESLGWVDRFLVIGFVGTTGFGYYMLGVMVVQACFIFPQIMASVVEPRLYYDYAKSRRISDIHHHLWVPLKILSLILPLVMASIDLLLPSLIRSVFPAYVPGIASMRILVWGSVFMGLLVSTKSFIVAIGKQRQVLPFYIAASIVNLVIGTTLAVCGFGLPGIATGTLVAYASCATALLFFVFLRFGDPVAAVFAKVGALYLPIMLVFLLTVALPEGIKRWSADLSGNMFFIVKGMCLLICAVIFSFQLKNYFGKFHRESSPELRVLSEELESMTPAEALL